jgi:hypothetical protein
VAAGAGFAADGRDPNSDGLTTYEELIVWGTDVRKRSKWLKKAPESNFLSHVYATEKESNDRRSFRILGHDVRDPIIHPRLRGNNGGRRTKAFMAGIPFAAPHYQNHHALIVDHDPPLT